MDLWDDAFCSKKIQVPVPSGFDLAPTSQFHHVMKLHSQKNGVKKYTECVDIGPRVRYEHHRVSKKYYLYSW